MRVPLPPAGDTGGHWVTQGGTEGWEHPSTPQPAVGNLWVGKLRHRVVNDAPRVPCPEVASGCPLAWVSCTPVPAPCPEPHPLIISISNEASGINERWLGRPRPRQGSGGGVVGGSPRPDTPWHRDLVPG